MRKAPPLAALALLLPAFFALQSVSDAANSLAASWMVTYYLDPYGTAGGTQCVNFKKTAETNGVITGTWRSPTFPSWNGQWVQKGQHYSWYGTWRQSGANGASFDVGDFITANVTAESSSGSFTTGAKPVTQTTGTATMTQVASCKGIPVSRSSNPTTRY
ncbi:MAG: hypothetical protein JO043_10490 [Candidatus Eremiobacteraeota bacterium]|nr:hypothetical protein [Candidatus Eremiobacteraeota bacterium]